jgi:hypothetical protein
MARTLTLRSKGTQNTFQDHLVPTNNLLITAGACSKLLDDEGMTRRVLTFGLPAVAQEQDGHSKPKKPKTS